MKDPWTWTMVWGLTMELGVGLGGGKQREEKWDNCNSINNKIFLIMIKKTNETYAFMSTQC